MNKEIACTDAGNCERFVAQHTDKVKYLIEGKCWITWDGARWVRKEAKTYERAIKTAKGIYTEARDCTNWDARERELATWAKRSQSRASIESMLKLASEELAVSADKFDTDPTVINCLNCVVDLKTGEQKPHSPDQMVMKRANVKYNPEAKSEVWNQFLKDIFQNDEKLIRSVRRILGYSLTGETKEQRGFHPHGLGENGKSTLFESYLHIMGDYGTTTTFSTFLKRKTTGTRDLEALGTLKGSRFVLASETGNTAQMDEATYKRATGGDTLTGADLYAKRYDFEPTHKLFLQCNHLPTVKDASHAFWRRPIVIPFKVTFDKKVDRDLRSKLLKEKEGIFASLVREAVAYYKEGLGEIAPALLEATKEWREDNDVLSRFISDCMEPAFGESIALEKEAFATYKRWAYDAGEYAISVGNFSKGLKERNIQVRRTNASNVIDNYKLKTQSQPNLGVVDPVANPSQASQDDPFLRADITGKADKGGWPPARVTQYPPVEPKIRF